MKYFQIIFIQVIFVLILLVQNSDCKCSKLITFAKNIRTINDDLKNFLDDIRHRMCYPISKLKLPPLDPFTKENFQYNLTAEFGNFDFLAKNVEAKGLSDFVVKDLRIYFLSQRIVIDIYIPKEIIDFKYKLNGSLSGLFDIDAEGDMNFIAEKVGFRFEAKLHVTRGIKIAVTKLEPYIEKFDLRIDNLFPDKELNDFFNQMIKDLAPEMVNNLWKNLKGRLISYIEKIVADLLKDYSIVDLTKLINSLKFFFDESDPEPNCKSKKFASIMNH